MPTQPSEILDLAGRIRDANPHECGLRSAASRAYYAALHRTEQVFGSATPAQGERLSSHERVIQAAANRARSKDAVAPIASRVAANLTSMRIARNKADYQLQNTFSEAQCRDMFIRAHAVMKACEQAGE